MTSIHAATVATTNAATTIATYTMSERTIAADFGIRDETTALPNTTPHRHEYFQLQFNLTGETHQMIGGARRPITPGTVSFVLPYRVHYIAHAPMSRYFIINANPRFLHPELEVDPLDLDDVPLERAPELAPFIFQELMDFALDGANFAEAAALCCALQSEALERGFCSTPRLRAQLVLLTSIVCRRYAKELELRAVTRAGATTRRAAMARVGRFIRAHYARPVTLGEAAGACCQSPHYLAHLLKRETGKTFVDLVTQLRMGRAVELLLHSSTRIADVGRAIGFEDEAYFARRFKQLHGASPRAYRLRHSGAAQLRSSQTSPING